MSATPPRGLEPGLHAGERLVTPLGELAGSDAELSAERVEGLAAEEAQHDLGLAADGPASLSQRSPSSAPPALRAHFAAEGLSCRGFFMVSCIVPSRLRRVSQETVQRTSGTLRRGTSMAPCI